jgi:predicted oxidoreductase
LDCAFDSGIRYFDVARMYGLGAVEGEVGEFLSGRRGDLVIATKFGIDPSRTGGLLAPVQSLARFAVRVFPPLRALARRRAQVFHQVERRYTAQHAARSLEVSLRELGLETIDILLMHEPELAQIERDELLEFLQRQRAAGRIRSFGVAAYFPQVRAIAAALPELCRVIQTDHDVFSGNRTRLEASRDQDVVTFSALAAALPKVRELVAGWPDVFQGALDDCGLERFGPEAIPKLLLEESLFSNEEGVVIFSSSSEEHIRSLARAGESSPASLQRASDFFHALNRRLGSASE